LSKRTKKQNRARFADTIRSYRLGKMSRGLCIDGGCSDVPVRGLRCEHHADVNLRRALEFKETQRQKKLGRDNE